MPGLTLKAANAIAESALRHAREKALKPMAVAVLDGTGGLKAFQKEDGASLLRFEVAFGKAFGAFGMGRSSRALAEQAKDRPAFVNSLVAAAGGRLVPMPGGVLVHDADGTLIGAVGTSGDSADNDEACAIAGVVAAGFKDQA
jgi:uncharacterized protein GlcG (DUF336 family)